MRAWKAVLLSCSVGLAGAETASHEKVDHTPAEISTNFSELPKVASEEKVEVLEAEILTNKFSSLSKTDTLAKFQVALESARYLRRGKELKRAESAYIQLLEGRAPDEIKRPALLDLALVKQEQREFTKAQHLFAEYVRRFPKDASVPEVLLRQAYLYRDMGVPVLALSKFYAVISSCLNLQLDQLEYYQQLVLRAQAEIAETYFLDGKFAEAADYFNRLLRLENEGLDRAEALFKLARCYSAMGKDNETIAAARSFLDKFADHADAAEIRFLLASGLKKLGRTDEAVREIEQLLKVQQVSSKVDPKQWVYWQQRAGNEVANQLYREADFVNALQIYNLLAELNKAAEWQIPVWYQIGLVLENLKQPGKATEMYDRVMVRQKEATEKAPNAALKQISEMAAWRKQCLNWETTAQSVNRELQNGKQEAL